MFEKRRAELDEYNSGWHTGFCAGVLLITIITIVFLLLAN